MVCPICGTDCKEARICPNCEWDLTADAEIPERLIGRYDALDGYLDVSYCEMVFHKQIHERTVDQKIFYWNVGNVAFRCATETESGCLVIRCKNDVRPLKTTELDAVCDETALIFDLEMNSKFCELFNYLNTVATGVKPVQTRTHRMISCPRCKSEKYVANRKRIYVPHSRSNSFFLAILYVGLYLYAMITKKDREYVCLSCGHSWTL